MSDFGAKAWTAVEDALDKTTAWREDSARDQVRIGAIDATFNAHVREKLAGLLNPMPFKWTSNDGDTQVTSLPRDPQWIAAIRAAYRALCPGEGEL